MSKTQHYGIKFPFSIVSDEKSLLDANMSLDDSVRSQMMHVVFTPRGQRLRSPDFGTRLIQYIFNPNDGDSWGDIVCEIKDAVAKWVPRCRINDVLISETMNGLGLAVMINYTVIGDNGEGTNYIISTNI